MRNNWKSSVLVIGLGLALTANVFGQASAINGEITGTVTDPSGAAIAGATVEISNTDTGFKQSTKTGDSGLYRFTVLPLGTYEIAVQAAGFGATRRSGIVLSAGATATRDITVDVAGTTTMVDVSASAELTEPSRIDLGSTLSENMTRNLPLVSRNPYNFILFQPNVSGRANTEFGVPRKINANGFNGRIYYELDGSNNTESDRVGIRLIPISDIYVAEVQQVSNGFAPEFGNTVGAVFNTITKSGANDFHGEGAYLFRRTDFSARPKLLASTALVPDVNVDSYSVDGGDRLDLPVALGQAGDLDGQPGLASVPGICGRVGRLAAWPMLDTVDPRILRAVPGPRVGADDRIARANVWADMRCHRHRLPPQSVSSLVLTSVGLLRTRVARCCIVGVVGGKDPVQ